MGVQAALAVLLLFIAAVKADNGGVTFSGVDFTMTCPQEGDWYKIGRTEILNSSQKTWKENYENNKKSTYYCEYDQDPIDPTDSGEKTKYYFYVQGKVCENCYELDGYLFGLAIVVDVLGTAFVMIIIYRFTKNKISAGLTNTSKAPARSGGQAPPIPSPDYEQLSSYTRSQDPYSIVNRMG